MGSLAKQRGSGEPGTLKPPLALQDEFDVVVVRPCARREVVVAPAERFVVR